VSSVYALLLLLLVFCAYQTVVRPRRPEFSSGKLRVWIDEASREFCVSTAEAITPYRIPLGCVDVDWSTMTQKKEVYVSHPGSPGYFSGTSVNAGSTSYTSGLVVPGLPPVAGWIKKTVKTGETLVGFYRLTVPDYFHRKWSGNEFTAHESFRERVAAELIGNRVLIVFRLWMFHHRKRLRPDASALMAEWNRATGRLRDEAQQRARGLLHPIVLCRFVGTVQPGIRYLAIGKDGRALFFDGSRSTSLTTADISAVGKTLTFPVADTRVEMPVPDYLVRDVQKRFA